MNSTYKTETMHSPTEIDAHLQSSIDHEDLHNLLSQEDMKNLGLICEILQTSPKELIKKIIHNSLNEIIEEWKQIT